MEGLALSLSDKASSAGVWEANRQQGARAGGQRPLRGCDCRPDDCGAVRVDHE